MYYGLREIKKELIRVNYIVKPETQHIEKKHENVEKEIYSSSVYSK
jgi:hypothetical protein